MAQLFESLYCRECYDIRLLEGLLKRKAVRNDIIACKAVTREYCTS
jgi:hypothetical protein